MTILCAFSQSPFAAHHSACNGGGEGGGRGAPAGGVGGGVPRGGGGGEGGGPLGRPPPPPRGVPRGGPRRGGARDPFYPSSLDSGERWTPAPAPPGGNKGESGRFHPPPSPGANPPAASS